MQEYIFAHTDRKKVEGGWHVEYESTIFNTSSFDLWDD
jgi:hypothetical protein